MKSQVFQIPASAGMYDKNASFRATPESDKSFLGRQDYSRHLPFHGGTVIEQPLNTPEHPN